MTAPTPKIDAIYPLQHLQQALLFHHLSAPRADEGLIQTRCRLVGKLDQAAFREAWRLTFLRHEALRASVHWEKVAKPVWVVHPQVKPAVEVPDWSDRSDAAQRTDLEAYLREDRQRGLVLNQTPTSRLVLIRLAPTEHFFLWTSHHLLLDGWSAGVVLRDFLAYYAGEVGEGSPDLVALPTHKAFLQHLRAHDPGDPETYWRERLARLTGPTLLPEVGGAHTDRMVTLSEEVRDGFIAYCKRRRLTQNTVFQGLWALVLGRYLGSDRVCFGMTVNGRPPGIADVDQLAGMFARILPKVIELDGEGDFFQRIQHDGAREAAYQYISLDQVSQWSGGVGDRLPFNCMLAVQNYPWSELAGGGLRVKEFAGDTTSRYPVTCMVVPRGAWTLHLRYREDLPGALPAWLLTSYAALICQVAGSAGVDPPDVSVLAAPPERVADGERGARPVHVAPRNPTELRLAGIWEQLLPVDHLGIDDNFFDCGGTSMAALRMFARWEQVSGHNVAPSSLLTHPTIRQLSELLDRGDAGAAWNNLVPQRVSGSLPPVFCFHGGLGHVLMYRPLTRHLHPDRPVYGLQPNGIDGVSELDGSIEEMATHYLAEIDRLGAPDPLILVSYCYSGTICLEIGRQLVAAGRPAPIFIGADIDPPGLFTRPGARKIRRPGTPIWYWGHLRLRRWDDVWEQVARDFLPSRFHGENLRLRLRTRRLKGGLVEAFGRYREAAYGQPICLIRSAGLQSWDSHDYVLETWRRLSGDQLTVRDVGCQHQELFEEPAVGETARHIEAYIAGRYPQSPPRH